MALAQADNPVLMSEDRQVGMEQVASRTSRALTNETGGTKRDTGCEGGSREDWLMEGKG